MYISEQAVVAGTVATRGTFATNGRVVVYFDPLAGELGEFVVGWWLPGDQGGPHISRYLYWPSVTNTLGLLHAEDAWEAIPAPPAWLQAACAFCMRPVTPGTPCACGSTRHLTAEEALAVANV